MVIFQNMVIQQEPVDLIVRAAFARIPLHFNGAAANLMLAAESSTLFDTQYSTIPLFHGLPDGPNYPYGLKSKPIP
jgi:hypothetical protein